MAASASAAAELVRVQPAAEILWAVLPARGSLCPFAERNSPDAAARCSQPIVAQSLAAPGSPFARPGSRHLTGPGPLAASSPAIVRAANRLLRSEPAQAAPPQGTYHAESSAVAKANAEVTLASPLRRSMQWASRGSAGQSSQPTLLYAAVGTSDNFPETRLDEWGQARVGEPQTLAMLRSSGILQRDGPLAASGAAALARASAQQPAVSLRRPHPADLEAAERLRASLSSEGGSSSRASSEPTCRARQPPKQERIKEEEGVLRASGWTQAPSTPKHALRQSALPDSPFTSTSSVAHETCGPGQPDAQQSPARAGMAAGKQPAPTVPKHLATPSLMLRAGDAAVYDEPEVDRVTPRGEPPLHAVADCTEANAQTSNKRPPPVVAGETKLKEQDDVPDRLAVSASALAAAAARLKPVSCPPAAPPPPPPPSNPKVAQQVAPEAKGTPMGAPADAREAMLSAIKNGQFQLRKATPHLKEKLGQEGTVEDSHTQNERHTPAMAALLERARAMRAAAYPPSTVNGSEASSWDA
ncbi:hypothetical protein WJX75_007009 [Coccomyxa subellipsoidea]|uniref:WH2 domain-containing protein n=1 Tax=Coccomyxa subellipsoidea TaxID=248742 RepID=A0ABR2YJV6_9CHLO